MSVLVDTSALLALLDEDDVNHTRASKGWQSLVDEDLIAHAYVIVESIALVRNRLGWDGADGLANRLIPCLRVEMVDRSLHDQAFAAYRAEHRGKSFVDHVTIAFARRHDIDRVFAFDRDLTTAGLTLIG